MSMYNSLTEKLGTSRGGAVLLGVLAAVIAAILLVVYITNYRDSVKSDATPVSVLTAKRLIPAGTAGTEIGSKQLYTFQSVPKDQLTSGAITDPSALNGVVTARDVYPGQQLTSADFTESGTGATGVVSSQLKANQRAVLLSIGALDGDLNNLRPGDHVDIYQQVSGTSGTIIKLFRANVPVQQVTVNGSEGQVVLVVPTRDAADVLFASKHTPLSFVLRPASGSSATPATTASNQTMLSYSHTH
jgi:Flp pilus assembly protein CpaB